MKMEKITIRQASLDDIRMLMAWRMEVLHCVFALPDDADTASLQRANEEYYRRQLPSGGHIACFARLTDAATADGQQQEQIVGCGGLCLYDEMPSPDNPTGRCAYLMNVYVRAAHRRRGTGQLIVQWLVSEARRRGITKICLETSAAGRQLYEASGFSDMEGMMQLMPRP